MFAVPEVDDDIEASPPVEDTKPITEVEVKSECQPPQTSVQASSSVDKLENNSIIAETSPPLEPASSKQHRSRRGLFHRNTIHICDQIVDRM